ncbi:MAG: hypothetical protein WKH97_00150 [Casimicrobiaceae bacterium]
MATSKRPRAEATSKIVRRKTSARARRQDGYHEDVGDLLRKGEWFRRYRTLNGDVSLASLRAAALKQADALGSIAPAVFAVGGAVPRAAFDLVSNTNNPARVKRALNPAPNASLGFAGPTVEVAARGESEGARLRVKLDLAPAKRFVVETVRMFRYEPSTKRWVLVPRSGVAVDGSYAWVYLHRPGLYTPIGLPRDPGRLRLVWMLYTMKPVLRRVREAGRLPALRTAIANQASIGQLLEGWLDDPDTPAQFDGLDGDGPRPPGPIGLPPRLPPGLPPDGLPEFDILDDICPPWRGRRFPLRPDGIFLPDLPIKPWPPFIWGWRSAGPLNFSGRIKSLAINPLNRNVLYAGAADGGVWKSTNAGGTWQAMMFTELSMAIGAIAVARTNTNVVYAATGEDTPGWGPSYPGVGVYRSNDAGLTWTQFGNGVVGNRCTRILVDPANADRVFVASNTGLFLSTTGGTAWSNVLPGHICDAVMEPTNPNRLFAAIWNDGVYRSFDGGATWERAGLGVIAFFKEAIFWRGQLPTGINAEWIKLAMGLNGAHGPNYLLAKMGTDSGKVYRSTNGGMSFFAFPGTHQPASYNEWTNMVAVNPDNHNVIFAGGVGIERSTNGGATFTGIGGTHSDHHQIVFDPVDSNVCYLATDGGVYKSTNAGATWTLASTWLVATQLYSIGVSQSGPFKLGSGTQDQGIVATEGPTTWRDTNAGNEGGFFVVDPNSSANIYTTPWSNNLRRSRDGGFTWTDIRNGMTAVVGGMTTAPANVWHIAVKPGDSNTLIAVGIITATAFSSPRIFRSTDQGDNWTSVLTLIDNGTRVAFAPSSAGRVYVSTQAGRVFRSNTSGSSGSFSEPYVAANRPTNQAITALAIGWNDANLIWIGCAAWGGARVLRSTDGGANWADCSGVLAADQLPNMPVSALVIDQNNPDVVYVANDIGVFRTQDGGNSWQDFSDGFLNQDVPRIIVTELALRRSTNTIYASTMGRGAYRRAL